MLQDSFYYYCYYYESFTLFHIGPAVHIVWDARFEPDITALQRSPIGGFLGQNGFDGIFIIQFLYEDLIRIVLQLTEYFLNFFTYK